MNRRTSKGFRWLILLVTTGFFGFLAMIAVTSLAHAAAPLTAQSSDLPQRMFTLGYVDSRGAPFGPLTHDGDEHSGDGEVKGIVLEAPAGFVGNWVIESSPGLTHTVVVTSPTVVSGFAGIPNVIGYWIEAKGNVQPDGSLLASRLRPEEHENGQVVVRFRPDMTQSEITAWADLNHLKPLSATLASANIFLFETELDDEENALARILSNKNDPDVIWAELNYIGSIPEGSPYRTWRWGGDDGTGYTNQSAFEQVNLPAAQAYYSGTDVLVAFLDSGVDLGHPALQGKFHADAQGHIGIDLVDDDWIPLDDGPGLGQGHGTHISGIVAHIAPEAKLLPIRVLDPNGRGNTFILAYGIEWAVNQGADVINLSLGSPFDSAILRDTIEYATDRGVVVVAAAGNGNTSTKQYPAAYPGVLAVTAVDEHFVKPIWANFGDDWIDLAAPGEGITSTFVTGTSQDGFIHGYASWSGTSMAAPFVSGAAALGLNKDPDATPEQIAEMLVAAGDNIDNTNPGLAGMVGSHLNVTAAVVGALEPNPEPPTPNDPPLNVESLTHKMYLPAVVR